MKLDSKLKAESPVNRLHPFEGLTGFFKAHLGIHLEIALQIPEGVLNKVTSLVTDAVALKII
jgi:hypothetical protein